MVEGGTKRAGLFEAFVNWLIRVDLNIRLAKIYHLSRHFRSLFLFALPLKERDTSSHC